MAGFIRAFREPKVRPKQPPSILGKRMRRAPSGALIWKRGPIGVTIQDSVSGDRPDFQVWVEVFGFGVVNDWRMTEALGAEWAERKLLQLYKATRDDSEDDLKLPKFGRPAHAPGEE